MESFVFASLVIGDYGNNNIIFCRYIFFEVRLRCMNYILKMQRRKKVKILLPNGMKSFIMKVDHIVNL